MVTLVSSIVVALSLADAGKPSADFVLHAGDVLYIPRGHVHDALTSDSVSLHVTLGIWCTACLWVKRAQGTTAPQPALFPSNADRFVELLPESRGRFGCGRLVGRIDAGGQQ